MIEILIGLGWIVIGYLIVTACLLGYFFLPMFWDRPMSDPSGGLLVAFLSAGLVLICLTWPISIPIMIYHEIKYKKSVDTMKNP